MHQTPNTTPAPAPAERLLRLPEVEGLVGLRKSKLYDLVKQGQFPAPVKLGPRSVRWRASAILKWIDGLKTDPTGQEASA